MIHFKNSLNLSEHEIDQSFNERRLALVPQIEALLSTHTLLEGKNVSVEFAHTGVSSLVCFVEAEDKKYVLKIRLSYTVGEGEGLFLKKWKAVGVCVPHIFGNGKIGEHFYTLMEYIDASCLNEAIENGTVPEDAWLKMGQTLALMHTATSEGYGQPVHGKPEHGSLKEWLTDEHIQKRVREVQEKELLSDEHGSISKAFTTLLDYTENKQTSSYCHFDFSPPNIFATNPLTVFDPNPTFNQGIIDIGWSIFLAHTDGFPRGAEQLKEGYFGTSVEFEAKALQASIILTAYFKFPRWHKRNMHKEMQCAREYLAENRHFLY